MLFSSRPAFAEEDRPTGTAGDHHVVQNGGDDQENSGTGTRLSSFTRHGGGLLPSVDGVNISTSTEEQSSQHSPPRSAGSGSLVSLATSLFLPTRISTGEDDGPAAARRRRHLDLRLDLKTLPYPIQKELTDLLQHYKYRVHNLWFTLTPQAEPKTALVLQSRPIFADPLQEARLLDEYCVDVVGGAENEIVVGGPDPIRPDDLMVALPPPCFNDEAFVEATSAPTEDHITTTTRPSPHAPALSSSLRTASKNSRARLSSSSQEPHIELMFDSVHYTHRSCEVRHEASARQEEGFTSRGAGSSPSSPNTKKRKNMEARFLIMEPGGLAALQDWYEKAWMILDEMREQEAQASCRTSFGSKSDLSRRGSRCYSRSSFLGGDSSRLSRKSWGVEAPQLLRESRSGATGLQQQEWRLQQQHALPEFLEQDSRVDETAPRRRRSWGSRESGSGMEEEGLGR